MKFLFFTFFILISCSPTQDQINFAAERRIKLNNICDEIAIELQCENSKHKFSFNIDNGYSCECMVVTQKWVFWETELIDIGRFVYIRKLYGK
jgi:hypothetical protein